jgi:DNA-directed RNA polymerase II subunit RPB1
MLRAKTGLKKATTPVRFYFSDRTLILKRASRKRPRAETHKKKKKGEGQMDPERQLFEQSLSSPTFWNSLSRRHHHDSAQRIRSVEFQVLGDEEIRRLSAVRVHSTTLYDKYIPKTGGMNDLRMGTIDRKYECSTCHNDLMTCPGHCGHIELSTPIFHPAFVSNLLKILRCICPVCYDLVVPLTSSSWYNLGEKLRHSLRRTRLQIISSYLKSRRHCCNEGCGFPIPAYTLSSFCIRRKWTEKAEAKIRVELGAERAEELLRPLDPRGVRKIVSLAKREALKHLGLLEDNHPRKYVMSVLLVPPPCIRPAVNLSVSNRTRGQDDLTQKLVEILKASNRLGKLLELESGAKADDVQSATDVLQGFVCLYFNSDCTGTKIPARKRTMATQKSLVGRLKGKSGRMRGNLQGKRVDFSSRSVISGDSHIDPDEIGVPVDIALSLTFTDTVNRWNLSKLQAMVARGPDVPNGAKSIISGRTAAETSLRYSKRTNPVLKLQVGDRVRRYMQTGDIVLFNRQPSLREKSIMAHRVVVMPEKTFRLNLCCTSPYNADFDGDEMNLHFLQSVTACTEARLLASVSQQILNGQNNKPCMGIIQDSLVGAYLMTSRNTFLTRGQVMQLMMKMRHAGGGSVRVPRPCILRPRPLWSGKQVFSLLMPNISFIRGDAAGGPLSDKTVVVRRGQLLCGQLCKRTLGSCSAGVIHNTCLLRSPERAVKFMGDCQRVVNEWLQSYGLSVGVTDCLISPEAKSRVRSATSECFRRVYAIEDAGRKERVPFGKRELEASKRLGKMLGVAGECVEKGLDPQRNGLVAMVRSGSKGSSINISQIMGLVGQQSVEGKRIYTSFRPEARVLSCALPSEARGAGNHGFVRNSYVDGLEPDEMFFHTMGGREGLVDTSVKTADTGYLQRRIVKATEGCIVQYDGSVRGPSGMVIEPVYGTDGCDASRLRKVHMGFLRTPERELHKTHRSEGDELERMGRLIRECLRVKITPYEMQLDTTAYLPVDPGLLLLQVRVKKPPGGAGTMMALEAIAQRIGRLLDHLHEVEQKTSRRTLFLRACVAWHFRARNLRGLPETEVSALARAVEDAFEMVAIAPGAMVGILAATSVGEPCTQLTLNTFHFAGV